MPALFWSLAAAAALLGLGDPRAHLAWTLGIVVVWGLGVVLLPTPRGGPVQVLLAALAVRALLMAVSPTLSDDLYRYVWEGHVAASGGNPYLHAPDWAGYPADPIRARVNHPEVSTIYPPLAMAGFSVLSTIHYGIDAPKVGFGLADALLAGAMAAVLAGRRRPLRGAWIYALHPLGAVESAVSGHLDAAALLCLVGAIGLWDRAHRTGRGDAGVGLAVLGAGIKLFPALVLPALLRGRGSVGARVAAGVAAGGLLAVLAWPFLDPTLTRGLGTYAATWSFNGSVFPILDAAVQAGGGDEAVARRVALGLGAAIVAGALWRRRDPAEVALWAGGAFVLLSPTVHPWYALWVWVPALLCGVRAWTVLATLIPLAYTVLSTLDPATGQWQESPWTAAAIYAPFAAALAAEALGRAVWPARARSGP